MAAARDRHAQDLIDIQAELSLVDSGRYGVSSYLGRGSYGVVVSATDHVTGSRVAVKCIYSKIFSRPALATRVLREILLMAHFGHHPNVIGIQDLLLSTRLPKEPRVFIVMDVMDMDLTALLRSGQPITEQHVQFFTVQILSALDCIHSAGVIHRDLTPNNCLLSTSCDLKVCDFGLAREQEREMTEYVVMRWYRAPELIMQLKYDGAVDIWACGCILAFMLRKGDALFKGENSLHQLQAIVDILGAPSDADLRDMCGSGGAADAVEFVLRSSSSSSKASSLSFESLFQTPEGEPISADAQGLLRWMLAFNPRNRPTARQALCHPYLHTYQPESWGTPCPKFSFGFGSESLEDGHLTLPSIVGCLQGLQRRKQWGGMGRAAPESEFQPAVEPTLPSSSSTSSVAKTVTYHDEPPETHMENTNAAVAVAVASEATSQPGLYHHQGGIYHKTYSGGLSSASNVSLLTISRPEDSPAEFTTALMKQHPSGDGDDGDDGDDTEATVVSGELPRPDGHDSGSSSSSSSNAGNNNGDCVVWIGHQHHQQQQTSSSNT